MHDGSDEPCGHVHCKVGAQALASAGGEGQDAEVKALHVDALSRHSEPGRVKHVRVFPHRGVVLDAPRVDLQRRAGGQGVAPKADGLGGDVRDEEGEEGVHAEGLLHHTLPDIEYSAACKKQEET